MIAKAVFVTADLQSKIINVASDFASILPVDADLVNRITEGKIRLQEKEVTPTNEEQKIISDVGYNGLSKVTVHAIPHNYGLITWSGLGIRVS